MKTVDDSHATSSRIFEAVEAISQQEKSDVSDDQFEESTKVNQQKALTNNLSNTIPPVHSDPVEAFMILRSEKMNSKKSPNKSGGGKHTTLLLLFFLVLVSFIWFRVTVLSI